VLVTVIYIELLAAVPLATDALIIVQVFMYVVSIYCVGGVCLWEPIHMNTQSYVQSRFVHQHIAGKFAVIGCS